MIHRLAQLAPPRGEIATGVSTLFVFAAVVAFAVLRLAQTAPIEP